MPRIVIVTGLSGSGKTTALRALEDAGFFCMDNLPVVLLPKVIELAGGSEMHPRFAVVVDAREPRFLIDAGRVLDELRDAGHDIGVVFLDASTDILLRRFKETRRPHPLDRSGDLRGAILEERRLLDDLRNRATAVVETTGLSVHDLTRRIAEIATSDGEARMRVRLLSFGFKHGTPAEADLVLDVRFLRNPYFDPELRHATGLEARVQDHVAADPGFAEFLERVSDLLRFLLPRYEAEGKHYLTIAFGCTGGQHRSVTLVERLAPALRDLEVPLTVEHRERAHWPSLPFIP